MWADEIQGGTTDEFHIGRRLPLRLEARAGRMAATGYLVFGLAVVGALGTLAYMLLLREGVSRVAPFVVAVITAAAGAWAFLRARSLLRRRLAVTVDAAGVTFFSVDSSGGQQWSEPLRNYLGVLSEVETVRVAQQTVHLHRAILKHARDPKRDIPLFRSPAGDLHRVETEAFARLLSKPVLTETVPGKYAGRNLADLDKSVRELVAQGTLARPVAPTAPLESKTLVTTRTPDGYIIEQVFNTTLYLALGLIVGLLMFCIGSGLLYYYFVLGAPGGSGNPIAVILGGAAFAVGGPLVAICAPLARIRLEIRPDEVRRMFLLGHFTITSMRAAAAEIEEVLVDEKHLQAQLRVVGDRVTIPFGIGLRKDEIDYVRDLVLRTLSTRKE